MNVTSKYYNYNGVNVLSLSGGSMYEKGKVYGNILMDTLHGARNHLLSSFESLGMTYEEIAHRAQYFWERYSYKYTLFLQGMSAGSELSLDDIKILNGMTTLNYIPTENIYSSNIPHCAFIAVPPQKTSMDSTIIGRNYDFNPYIYGPIVTNLTVTIISDPDTVPTAIIGMPGEIYCPSCLNSQGLFMELNAGSPSGGNYVNQARESILINMLEIMQNSLSLEDLHKQMMAMQSDYSMIVSSANASYAQSYELSSNSLLGMKPYSPEFNEPLIYTNFFLNSTWGSLIPVPTDNTTWMGVARRNNLLNLLSSQEEKIDLSAMKELMEVPLREGGAFWEATIYQLIFQPEDNIVSLRRSSEIGQGWVDIDLNEFYPNQPFIYGELYFE